MIKLNRRWKRRKKPVSVITAGALALASIALAAAPAASASTSAAVPRPALTGVPVPLRQGMNTLVSGVSSSTGLIGSSFWQAAVAVSTIETYQQTTGDRSYQSAFVEDAYRSRTSPGDYEDNLDDDTAWWGLALLQAYDITRYSPYLDYAENIADYIHDDWDSTCGGGVWWQRSPHHAKNAIANELFLELTASLHNTIVENHLGADSGKNSYLSWAMQEWAWLQQVGMISNGKKFTYHGKTYTIPASLVTDGITNSRYDDGACSDGNIAPDIFTYNQGVILAGLAQLYEATRNNPAYGTQATSYLREAENIANAVLIPPTPLQVVDAVVNSLTGEPSNILTFFGVLNEPTRPLFSPACCLGDEAAFKGIFVRDLKTLDDVIASAPKNVNQCTAMYNNKKYSQCTVMYNDFFRTQANAIENVDTTPVPGISGHRWFGFHWTGPPEPYNYATQASALEALIAALPTGSSS